MKKLLFILLIILSTLVSAQFSPHRDWSGLNYSWKLTQSNNDPTSAVYIEVIRSLNTTAMGYEYQVAFFSNSYRNGYIVGTYMTTVTLYVQDFRAPESRVEVRQYVLAGPKTKYSNGITTGFIFHSTSPQLKIRITWNSMISY